jgi:hypothetical protein
MAELGESANPTDLVTSLRSGGDAAPERGFWDEVGEFFSGAGEGIGEFDQRAGTWVLAPCKRWATCCPIPSAPSSRV